MSVKLKVFISSGMAELRAERQAVQAALRNLEVDPWLFEDDAGAQSIEGRAVYLRELAQADLYLGIFWRQYGKYTIDEYTHAIEAGNDCLIFEKDVDVEDRDVRLTEFLERIGHVEDGHHTIKRFRTIEELAQEARKAVAAWQTRRIRAQRQRGIPEFLAYRCDRTPQIAMVQGELGNSGQDRDRRNIVCVVHGERLECHRELIEVLVRYTVPQGTAGRSVKPVRHIAVPWPGDAVDQEEFAVQLTGRISDYRYGGGTGAGKLAAELDGHQGPVFVHVYVEAADLKPTPRAAIDRFVRYWSDWPSRSAGEVLIAFLCIRYAPAEHRGFLPRLFGGGAGRQTERVRALLEDEATAGSLTAAFPRTRVLVARELPDIGAVDAELWADLPDVVDLAVGRTPHIRSRIRELYDDVEIINERTRRISMEPLARRLESILRDVRA